MLRGSCLCGGICYEISGKLYAAVNCHCSMCRKAQGAAFRSRAKVLAADFRFTAGEQLLTFFESSPGSHRGFCRVCGSPMLTKFDTDPTVFGLPLGALDDDPGIRPEMHVYVASKAPWFAITDDLPQFAELPQSEHPVDQPMT
ncbi:MAG: GFA family protein [Xanthobacteraceae bacterium]